MADALIRALLATERAATTAELAEILAHVAAAPFDPTVRRVPLKHRGLVYQGSVLGARAASLDYHLVKRVLVERQWAIGTTAAEYLADLGQAVVWPGARILVYDRAGEPFAAVGCATNVVLPSIRRGPETLPLMLVVYSARDGVIRTGYQFSDWPQVNLPGDTLWLT
jgi:hypothetical protein